MGAEPARRHHRRTRPAEVMARGTSHAIPLRPPSDRDRRMSRWGSPPARLTRRSQVSRRGIEGVRGQLDAAPPGAAGPGRRSGAARPVRGAARADRGGAAAADRTDRAARVRPAHARTAHRSAGPGPGSAPAGAREGGGATAEGGRRRPRVGPLAPSADGTGRGRDGRPGGPGASCGRAHARRRAAERAAGAAAAGPRGARAAAENDQPAAAAAVRLRDAAAARRRLPRGASAACSCSWTSIRTTRSRRTPPTGSPRRTTCARTTRRRPRRSPATTALYGKDDTKAPDNLLKLGMSLQASAGDRQGLPDLRRARQGVSERARPHPAGVWPGNARAPRAPETARPRPLGRGRVRRR